MPIIMPAAEGGVIGIPERFIGLSQQESAEPWSRSGVMVVFRSGVMVVESGVISCPGLSRGNTGCSWAKLGLGRLH